MKNVEDVYPLSPMQQGMLFHTIYDSGLYVEQSVCTLRGNLNIALFQQAWQQVLDLHPILRTAFLWKDLDTPLQVVRQRVQLPWSHEDWSALPSAEQEQRLGTFLREDRSRGIDVGRAPLMRMATFQTGPQSHYFVWSQHHMLLDGWSLPLVIRDVLVLYESSVAGQKHQLPRPRPYRDYIGWLQKQDMAEAERFWRRQLHGIAAATPLTVDRPATTGDSGSVYANQERLLPAEVSGQIQALAAGHGLTVNTLVQGAWAILLSRYSGEDDVVFGTTVSGRPSDLPGVEQMVGLFINTLPVRVQVAEDQPLAEWLQALQRQQVELRQYEYTPLVQIQGWSEVPRGQPLFESLLVFENYPISGGSGTPGQPPTLLLENMHSNEDRSNYPLNLIVAPLRHGLGIRASYDTARLDEAAVTRMLGHFETLLLSMVRQPTARVRDLELLTADEHAQLQAWNPAGTPRQPACLHHLFEQQAARTPETLALVSEDQQLTYRELDRRASQFARYLHSRQIGPGARVGLCLARSPEQIVAVLGILKAGAAYVPLDPGYPAELLNLMLTDSRAALLVTTTTLRGRLPDYAGPVLCLDEAQGELAHQPHTPPPVAVSPEQVANVIYTSGSTGRPKGVLVTHAGLCNTAAVQIGVFETGPGSQVLQFAPFSFDASVSEMMMALHTGATLHIAPPDLTLAGDSLLDLLQRRRITHVTLPPSVLLSLSEADLPDLYTIIVAGESCPAEVTQRWASERRLFNAYGPTEAAICATIERCGPDGVPPIGRPIEHTQVYLLDRLMRPVPVGVPGELYLAGAGLAHGYLGRADLTAERFVPNPFTNLQFTNDDLRLGGQHDEVIVNRKSEIVNRLYRTGDQGRYLPDGRIVFLGRSDHQIKLRGYRIEPGQIEATLSSHPAVQETVVIAREDAPGDKQLVAYVVLKAENQEPGTKNQASGTSDKEPAAQPAILKAFLAEHLPGYMVPGAFVVLEALPRTPNGKIDRKALPAPNTAQAISESLVPPRTPVEQLLADIWAEVLRLPQIGVHDSFFNLGGHSLNATQIVSRLRTVLQVDLPLRALFEAPTVAELAEWVAKQRSTPALLAPPLVPQERPATLPLSFAQLRLWFLDQLDPGSPAYNMPSALRVSGPLDVRALQTAINTVLQRHEILRTVVRAEAGEPAQVIHPFQPLELATTDLSQLPPAQREAALARAIEADAQQPFDLPVGPLFRAALLRADQDEHILLLNMHHIVADGWSASVLMRELLTVYQAEVTGAQVALPALPVQYADYALWQRGWLQGEALAAMLDYWRAQLADLQPLNLPADFPRPPVATLRGAAQPFVIPPALVAALHKRCRSEGVTPFMALLAVWQLLLARYSGQDDIAVGTPIAGRSQQATEGLIGCFINTLVLRSDLARPASFRELLAQVREMCLAAYAHQDMPFEQLVDALAHERDLSRHPLFQVMFTLQAAPATALHEAGLTLAPLTVDYGIAKFDLSLSLSESDAGLAAVLEYSTDLFAPATAERMARHFVALLEAALAQPQAPLHSLPLLAAEEQAALARWSESGPALPWRGSLPLRLHAIAQQTPAATALLDATGAHSFAALLAQAEHLAAHLAARTAQSEQPVALLLERTAALPAALLAVWLAGRTLLPLDPSLPPARIAQLLSDARPALVLASPALAALLPPDASWLVCGLDDLLNAPAPRPFAPAELAPEQPAYLIYTSGSTGTPKAVLASHGGLLAILDAASSLVNYRPGDVQPVMASAAFDIFLFELFAPLLAGAAAHILDRDAVLALAQDPAPLAGWSVLHAVPSLLRVLLDALETQPELPRRLRHILVGGDRVPPELLVLARRVLPEAELTVLYGPTETTILATAHRVSDVGVQDGHAWLGRPLAGVRVQVLDRHGQPVPAGVTGELFIGGAGVSLGYLNQPDLTAERFVLRDGLRWYRSGDQARWLQDGSLVFAGRVDGQVKLRGFRIELGEIEAVLARHPLVAEALVLVRGGEQNARLVAYVVPQSQEPGSEQQEPRTKNQEPGTEQGPAGAERSIEHAQLQAFLAERLPEYMVPSAFVVLERFPLTPNGKIDQRALPEPDERPEDTALVAPRTTVEATLAEIWSAVLRVPSVGVHDNFFRLGGDSILSIQIVARAGQAGLRITPRQLFQHQTIAELALVVEQRAAVQAPQGLIEGPAALTPIQHWFLRQNFPVPHHFNLDLLLLLSERVSAAALVQGLLALLAHHDALRLRFTHDAATGWRAEHAAPPAQAPLTLLDLSALPPEQHDAAQEHAAAAVQASLDLEHGPLLRALLVERGPHLPQRLLLVVHHLVVDVVSWGVLLADLRQAVAQAQQNQPIQLPPKTSPWRDWAAALTDYTTRLLQSDEPAYWSRVLQAAVPPLPRDHAHGPNSVADARHLLVALDEDETTALLQQVSAAYQTQTPDLLLTALAHAWREWTGSPLLRVALEGHGREEVLAPELDVTRTAGWFTAVYPLLLSLPVEPGPGVALKAIKEQIRQVPQHGVGYGLLREGSDALPPEPPLELSFNYLGQVDQTLGAASDWTPLAEPAGPAQHPSTPRTYLIDLTVQVRGGRLLAGFTYSLGVHTTTTVQQLAESYLTALRELIAHCLSPEAGGFTPSDFAEYQWDQTDLDDITAAITKSLGVE